MRRSDYTLTAEDYEPKLKKVDANPDPNVVGPDEQYSEGSEETQIGDVFDDGELVPAEDLENLEEL